MKVALLQMDIVLGDVAANRAKALAMLDEGIARGAGVLVLPEMWTTGYALPEIKKLAEPSDGPTLAMLREKAAKNRVEIITGSIAESRDGRVYNTCYAVGPRGDVVSRYSKIHLIGLMREDLFLAPGDSKAVFDMSFGRAGMIICYDLRFTELPRALALAGCRVLFVPAEWPAARGGHWRALLIARAIENQMFVVGVNRVGADTDNDFFGHSLVVDPWGEVIAEGSAGGEEVLVADIDMALVEAVRARMPVLSDRRPQLY